MILGATTLLFKFKTASHISIFHNVTNYSHNLQIIFQETFYFQNPKIDFVNTGFYYKDIWGKGG